jgi:hypothetical protein
MLLANTQPEPCVFADGLGPSTGQFLGTQYGLGSAGRRGGRGRRARGLWKTGLTHRSLRPGCHRGTHRAFRPLRAIAAIRPIRAHGTLWPAHPVGGSAKPAVRTGSHGAGRPRGGRWPWRLTRRRAWNRHHGRCRCTLRNAR